MPKVGDKPHKTVARLLLETSWLQAELKRRSLVYQRDAKLAVAKLLGLSWDEVDLPFAAWMVMRDRCERDHGLKL